VKYKIVNRPFVKQDISDAINYYKKISPRLAKVFLRRIREARNFIAENPFSDDVMYKDVRVRLIRQFPYQIHYLVDEGKMRIIVLAVVFAKREDLDFRKR
jgi:hypothetical protein